MGTKTVIRAGVMVYTIADGKLYSDSLPEEGAKLLEVISQEPGKQFEAIVKIRGHLWHLWSGKPIDEIRESVNEGDESIDSHEALAEYEAAKYRAQLAAGHYVPDFPWA